MLAKSGRQLKVVGEKRERKRDDPNAMHEVQRGKKRGIWQQCWFLEFSQKGF